MEWECEKVGVVWEMLFLGFDRWIKGEDDWMNVCLVVWECWVVVFIGRDTIGESQNEFYFG